MMYKAKVHEITSRTRSTRWNDPNTTTSEIRIAAIGALSQGGMPTRNAAAEMPAYSAQIVPKLANNSPSTAR